MAEYNHADYPIDIDGKTYVLRFKYLALETIANLTGQMSNELVSLKVIFYAGLRKHHPQITLDECAAIFDECSDFKKVAEDITNAFKLSTAPPETAAKKKNGAKAKDSA